MTASTQASAAGTFSQLLLYLCVAFVIFSPDHPVSVGQGELTMLKELGLILVSMFTGIGIIHILNLRRNEYDS